MINLASKMCFGGLPTPRNRVAMETKSQEEKQKRVVIKAEGENDLEFYAMDLNIFPAHHSYANQYAFDLKVYHPASKSEVFYSPTFFTFDSKYYNDEFPKALKCRSVKKDLAGHVITVRNNDELCEFIRLKIRQFCNTRK